MSVEAALAACRFLHDAAAMLLWGGFAYIAALVPQPLAGTLSLRLGRFRLAAGSLAAITTAAALPLETASVGDGWPASRDPTALKAVMLETSFGRAWQIQIAMALLLLGVLVFGPRRTGTALIAIVSGASLATVALVGHAAMHEGVLGIAHRLNDMTHLLAGGAWLGALPPLLLVMRALDDEGQRRNAALALRRFSNAGHAAVALVILTGAANGWLILGRWPLDWTSPYQALLAAKVAVVFTMAGLAGVNRYVIVPAIARRRTAPAALRIGTLAELGLGCVAVALVSVFGLLEPM